MASAFSESHVPRYRARVDTVIQFCTGRLSWRRRARPSTTLHEIQARTRQDRTRICIWYSRDWLTNATRVAASRSKFPLNGKNPVPNEPALFLIETAAGLA